MEITKAALENERKIQQLQMQAINALWKKVSKMNTLPVTSTTSAGVGTITSSNQSTENESSNQSSGNNNSGNIDQVAIVQDLAKTCTMLTNQVQQLQGSMRDVLNCMTLFCNISTQNNDKIMKLGENNNEDDNKTETSGTQTEIIAVNTPQVENIPFPFNNKISRPSTLPLDSTSPKSNNNNNINETIIKTEHTPTKEEDVDEKLNESNKDLNLPETTEKLE